MFKIKNKRLKFEDLRTNQTIYLSEPGKPVLEARVLGFTKTNSIAYELVGCNKYLPVRFTGLPYTRMSIEEFKRKKLPGWEHLPISEGVIKITKHRFFRRNVILEFLKVPNNTPMEMSGMYFNPSESHMRAFKKKKHAEGYSKNYPTSTRLASIYGDKVHAKEVEWW